MSGEDNEIRRAGSMMLALIAALSLMVGVVSLAARQTLFDEGGAEDLSSRLLDRPEVRSAMAQTLIDRLRAAEPALRDPALFDGLGRLATALVGTAPFRRTFSEALGRLQADLRSDRDLPVALRLDGMLDTTLAAIHERLGTTLHVPSQTTRVLPVDPDQAQAYRSLDEVTAQIGWPAIAIGAVAALGAVLVAGRRRRAIVGVGAAVATVALLALGGLVVAKSAATGRAGTPTSRDAVGAVWDVVAGDARSGLIALLLAGLGAVAAGLALQAYRGGRVSS
jgi:hypothetical protein